ncbi:helix-turn-helix domain-containing protein [Mycobacterium saskatchewanense]|nr:helix-turn-helix domain-containing protein [Mycobacterium saskatchewanense]
MVFRQALSKQNTPFVKLPMTPVDTTRPTSPQVSDIPPPQYRMTRRLTPDELDQVLELYRLGLSTYKLASRFGTDRHTITGHLRRGGVQLRSRQKLTPQLVEEAAQLYDDGQSLATIGKQFGVSSTTIGAALRKTGVRLRDSHGRST